MSRMKDLWLKVDGLKEIEKQLAELGAVAGVKTLAKDARKALQPVLEKAKAGVPVDTGLLRDSLRIVVKKPKSGNEVVVAGIRVAVGKGGSSRSIKAAGENANTKREARKATRAAWRSSAHWRWHFVEKGTSKHPARPFLRPAFNSGTPGMITTFTDEVRKDIKRLLRKRAPK